MGRPSLAKQRKAEILDAFGRCVARYGLEGSTLEKIAEEAGMRRSILRHYIGNRDELIEQLAEKVIAEYRQANQEYFKTFGDRDRAKNLVECLLPSQSIGSTEQLLVIEGLIGAAPNYPNVRKLVFEYVDELVQLVAEQLKYISPKSTKTRCFETAYALVSISFNQESLQPLQLPPRYLKAARRVARQLIEDLCEES